jgi:hypothetical protein
MNSLTSIQKEFILLAIENYGPEILESIFGVPDEEDSVPPWALDEIHKLIKLL